MFFCEKCNIILETDFISLNIHKSHIEELIIKNETDLDLLSEEEFNKFFDNKEKKGFLGKTFSNVSRI